MHLARFNEMDRREHVTDIFRLTALINPSINVKLLKKREHLNRKPV